MTNMETYQMFADFLDASLYNLENNDSFNFVRRHEDAEKKSISQQIIDYRVTKERLQDAVVFEMEDDVRKLLAMMKPSYKLENIRLPYPSIFIDAEFDGSEFDCPEQVQKIKGILLYEANRAIDPLNKFNDKIGRVLIAKLITTENQVTKIDQVNAEEEKKILDKKSISVIVDNDTAWNTGSPVILLNDLYWIIELDEKYKNMKISHVDSTGFYKQFKPVLLNFILSFFELFYEPEVEIVHVKRSLKNQERRIKNGKRPLPASYITKLTGKIKRYVSELKDQREFKYSCRFWVRRHKYVYKHPKWKEKVGTYIWISPFIKGEGAMKRKIYDVEPKKEEYNDLKKQFLFFESIKPLERPLREMRV